MHETQMLKGHLLVKHSSTLEIGIKLVYSRSQHYMNVEERSCLADTVPLPTASTRGLFRPCESCTLYIYLSFLKALEVMYDCKVPQL